MESFKAFEKLCAIEIMDGKWIVPIIDHMTELLTSYAEESDVETLKNATSKQSQALTAEESVNRENQHMKTAMTLMETLFRRL